MFIFKKYKNGLIEMSIIDKNRLFTLTVVPDCGYDVKSGNINLRFITGFFSVLIILFFTSLFFIIGYHIKLSQEKNYIHAVSIMQEYLNNINETENFIYNLSEKILKIQRIDKAFRQYAYLPVPDDDMYKAGVGGHEMVDDSFFHIINEDLMVKLRNVFLEINTLDRQLFVEGKSLEDIHNNLQEKWEELNNTPTMLPIQSLNITSRFAMRINPITGRKQFHDAVDFTGMRGDKVFATADGIVIKSAYHNVRGNYVVIQHKYGYQTLYAHLNKMLVEVNQRVKKEDMIGTMGSSGRTTGTNLHYSITHNNRKVDPQHYF